MVGGCAEEALRAFSLRAEAAEFATEVFVGWDRDEELLAIGTEEPAKAGDSIRAGAKDTTDATSAG